MSKYSFEPLSARRRRPGSTVSIRKHHTNDAVAYTISVPNPNPTQPTCNLSLAEVNCLYNSRTLRYTVRCLNIILVSSPNTFVPDYDQVASAPKTAAVRVTHRMKRQIWDRSPSRAWLRVIEPFPIAYTLSRHTVQPI